LQEWQLLGCRLLLLQWLLLLVVVDAVAGAVGAVCEREQTTSSMC
jgi:hypothetical protein